MQKADKNLILRSGDNVLVETETCQCVWACAQRRKEMEVRWCCAARAASQDCTNQAQDFIQMRAYQDQDQDFNYQREITTK